MTNKYTHTVARINDSIKRIPDRLSTPKGKAVRSEFAEIFGRAIIGHENKDGSLYLTLPFQASLLTDPVLYIVAGGLLVLDHPTRSGASEFAFGQTAHIIDLNCKSSLYENRFPRMISCARKHETIESSCMVNRLMACNFRGPFAKATA